MRVKHNTEQFKSLVKDGLTVLWSINGEASSDQLENFIEEHKHQLNIVEWNEILSTLSDPHLVAVITSALDHDKSGQGEHDLNITIESQALVESQTEPTVPDLDEIFKKIDSDELVVEDHQVTESFKKWARNFQSKVFTLCQLERIDPYDADWWHVYIHVNTINRPMKKYLEILAKSVQGDLNFGLSVLSQIPDEALQKFVCDRFWSFCDDYSREQARSRVELDSGEGFFIGIFSFLFVIGMWWVFFQLIG